MSRRNKILSLKGDSFSFRSIAVIFCSLLILCSGNALSQVIVNNGAAVSVTTGTVVNSKDAINNPAGILYNSGTINLTGDFTNANTASTNGGFGTFRIGGNWTNNGVFTPSFGTVVFNGLINQSIIKPGGEAFNNLSIDNSGSAGTNYVGLINSVTVSGNLSMVRGNINAVPNKLLLSNSLPAALSYTSVTRSRILGKFERGVSQPGTYLFPMGTSANYNAANLITNSIAAPGTVLTEFITPPPSIDSIGLPIPDPPDEVARVWQDGYWRLTAANGFSTGNYNINLKAAGFTTFKIQDITRVIKRTVGSSNWVLDGTHSAATPADSVVYRNNLIAGISNAGTQFALAQSRPRIIKHPRDTTVCESKPYAPSYAQFEVVATSTRTLTYTWYKEPAVLLTGPHYNTTGPGTLVIIDVNLADAGKYYCIVSDDYGNSTRSLSATLVVNKRPIATTTPTSQPDKCSNVAVDNIVLGESYGVPGSTFIWTRDNPSGISSALPMAGTVPVIGGNIPGSAFTNSTDAPVTVTFSITPVGPSPTYCAGATVTATIRINPTPRVIPVDTKPQICYGGTTDITLTTPSVMTMGVIKFDYTVGVTGGAGIVTGDVTPKTDQLPGDKITRTYTNISDTLQSVSYYITPKVVGLGCPNGNLYTEKVIIHARPLQGITIVKQLTCEGGSDATLRAELSKGAAPYQIIWDGPVGYHKVGLQTITNLIQGRYDARIIDNLGCTNTNFDIVQGAYIDSYFDIISQVSCPGYSDGALRIKVNSSTTGTAPFTYWVVRNYQDTVTPLNGVTILLPEVFSNQSGLKAANYQLHIRDSKGCYDNSYPEVNIIQPDVMKVIFGKSTFTGGYNISCKGYSDGWAQINTVTGGNGGYTYHWFPKNGSFTIPGPTNGVKINNLIAGTYYLEVRDSKNCYMIDSVTLAEPAGMALAGSQVSMSRDNNFNISCNGSTDGFIKLTISGGSGSYIFSWTGPGSFTASTKDISNLAAGTYTLTVTDLANTSCILMPKPVFILTQPAPLTVSATKADVKCAGGTGSITLNVAGGSTGNYRYAWTTTNGSGIVPKQKNQNALTAGTYYVTVTDTNTCSASTSVTLTQPAPLSLTLVPTHITCQSPGFNNGSVNLTVTGGIVPYSYLWSNGATTEDISNLTYGKYRVTVTDYNNCKDTSSVWVNNPPPITYDTILSNHNGFNVSCYGMSDGSITIKIKNDAPPYIYDWQGPGGFTSSSQSISNLKAGQYLLNITDKNSCKTTGVFNVRQPGKLSTTLKLSKSLDGNHNINCAGSSTGSITVTPVNAVGGVAYLWSDGYTDQVRTNIPAGTYKVIILDLNNCNADTTIALTEPDSVRLSFDVRQAFCPDSPDGQITVNATGGMVAGDYSYKWSDGSTSRTITNILNGLYKVLVTDANKCSIADSVVMAPAHETCLIIPNAISPNDDNINDVWNIGMIQLYPQIEIKVYNRWGELVWKSAKGYPDPWDGRSNGIILPIDSYHYVIDLHNGAKPIVGNITIIR